MRVKRVLVKDFQTAGGDGDDIDSDLLRVYGGEVSVVFRCVRLKVGDEEF